MPLNLNIRRLILIIGFVLVVIGIGLAIYFVFYKNVFGPGANENENVNGAVLPISNRNRNVNAAENVNGLPNANVAVPPSTSVAEGGDTRVVPVVDTIADGATIAHNGRDLLYYDPKTGQFYSISPDGRTKTLLTPDLYPNVESIVWSPLRDKAVLEFPDGSKYLYDFRQKQQYTLAPEMEEIRFSPYGNELGFKFIGDNRDDRFLVISNFDGTGSETLEPLLDKQNQFAVSWSPAGNVVGTFEESIDADRQRVVPIGRLGENFEAFNVPGRGFESIWSPSGDKILYSVFSKESAYNPKLYVADGRVETIGQRNIDLGLSTWASKCAFGSGTVVYCAVPQYLEQGAGLYPETANTIPDDFYKIDLATGAKTRIAHPVDANGDSRFTASNLFVSSDESLLYFYDRGTNKIQKLQLR